MTTLDHGQQLAVGESIHVEESDVGWTIVGINHKGRAELFVDTLAPRDYVHHLCRNLLTFMRTTLPP